MNQNGDNDFREWKFIPLFQEWVLRQADIALVNIQKIYEIYQKSNLVRTPDGLLSCQSAEDASIEWIELPLFDAVDAYMRRSHKRVDTEWCKKFSHSVVVNLKKNGVETILQLYMMTKEELLEIEWIGETAVKCIHDMQQRLDIAGSDGGLPTAS